MDRIPIIAGNWKMYKTTEEARAFIGSLASHVGPERRVLLGVPFTALEGAVQAARGSRIEIGAQNMHDMVEGAFTGEISARMLKTSGVSFVILGHSERRQLFGETNAFIHRKVVRALQKGLLPILCIGELLQERESGKHLDVLKLQLEDCLHGVNAEQVVIAYEPVWAIGTGKTATPEVAQEVHAFIRAWLGQKYGSSSARKISILYGGSVKPDNIGALMGQDDIDGVLVGGASLEVEAFVKIINYRVES